MNYYKTRIKLFGFLAILLVWRIPFDPSELQQLILFQQQVGSSNSSVPHPVHIKTKTIRTDYGNNNKNNNDKIERNMPLPVVASTSSYPSFLVIIKSPRSGSTYLHSILKANPNIMTRFEGAKDLNQVRAHFEQCKKTGHNGMTDLGGGGLLFHDQRHNRHHVRGDDRNHGRGRDGDSDQREERRERKKGRRDKRERESRRRKRRKLTTTRTDNKILSCSISLNGYLTGGRERYDQINKLIQDYNATVVYQLRTNVVEKAISASKLWNTMKHRGDGVETKDITQDIAQELRTSALAGFNTIRGHIVAEKLRHQKNSVRHNNNKNPSLFVWYEDLVRECNATINTIYTAIGVPETGSVNCNEAFFKNETYNDVFVDELQKEPELIPMINANKFNREVDTNVIYQKYKDETKDIHDVLLGKGYWR